MTFFRIACVLFMWTGLSAFDAAVADDEIIVPRMGAFVDDLQCPVTATINAIHRSPRQADGLNRYIIVAIDFGQRYVQCRFLGEDKEILCEASSGYFAPRKHKLKISKQQRAAITAEGFVAEQHGNFSQTIKISRADDIEVVSRMLLRTLEKGYDRKEIDGVSIKATIDDLKSIFDRDCQAGYRDWRPFN